MAALAVTRGARILRLLTVTAYFDDMWAALSVALPILAALSVVWLMLTYSYVVVGMELFGPLAREQTLRGMPNDLDPLGTGKRDVFRVGHGLKDLIRRREDDAAYAFVNDQHTLFSGFVPSLGLLWQLTESNNWQDIMHPNIEGTSRWFSLYFTSYYWLCHMFLLDVIIGVTIDAVQAMEERKLRMRCVREDAATERSSGSYAVQTEGQGVAARRGRGVDLMVDTRGGKQPRRGSGEATPASRRAKESLQSSFSWDSLIGITAGLTIDDVIAQSPSILRNERERLAVQARKRAHSSSKGDSRRARELDWKARRALAAAACGRGNFGVRGIHSDKKSQVALQVALSDSLATETMLSKKGRTTRQIDLRQSDTVADSAGK
jgi:hypothetical protein